MQHIILTLKINLLDPWKVTSNAVRRVSAMFAKELLVQFDELSKETSVRNHTTALFHSTNSLDESEVLLQHQVSQDQGGRAAHSYMTVDQHFAFTEKY